MNPIEKPQTDVKYCDIKNTFFFFQLFTFFLKPKCSFVLYDLFGHSSQTLFLSFNVGFFVFIQTGV